MQENTEQPENNSIAGQKNRSKITLLASPEGSILLVGVALTLIYSSWLGIQFVLSPDHAQVLVGMTATSLMFGRAAGMAFGYSLALGHTTIILICMLIETVTVLIFYPLFVFSWHHLLVLKRLKKLFTRVQEAAEARKHFIHRYGVIGLFIFVWFPFWMTGPVVGSVIGFMLGLKVWINIPVVLAGTYVAILCWAVFLRHFHQRVASYSPYAAMIIMALLVVIIISGHLLHQTLPKNKNKM